MDLLQILGTAAMLTLAVICFKLSYPERNPLYIAVGQTVFRWIFFALVILALGRLATFFLGLDTEVARFINSGAFILAVFCITLNVLNFNRRRRKQ